MRTFALLLALIPSVTLAATPEIVAVRVGLADRYKTGLWTQVEVTLRGGDQPVDGQLSLVTPDGDAVPSRVEASCRLPAHQETVVRTLYRPGRVRGSLTVELGEGDRRLARRVFSTADRADAEHFLPGLEYRALIVTVGEADLDIERLGRLGGFSAEHRPVAARLKDAKTLPVDWAGYEGVDAVILQTSRPDAYRSLDPDSPQVRALDLWIRMGGRLILCGGDGSALASDGPLAHWLPGRFEKTVSLRPTGLGALESFCDSRSGVPRGESDHVAMRAVRLVDPQGLVEAAEGDLPLVVRAARGLGQVIFVAVDLDHPRLRAWVDRPKLIARLLDAPTEGEESDDAAAVMHFGYDDLSGQLRSALDHFPDVRPIPFWVLAGLIVAYLLAIGPGDYFFLRRLVGRMTWTWLTFPTIVLAACLLAYGLAQQFKGDRLAVNKVDLIDVDTVSGRLRDTVWFNVFSPRMEAFDVGASPCLPGGRPQSDGHAWPAWFGLPGSAIGGMDPRTGEPSLWTEPYRFASDRRAMFGVPMAQWSTKSFTVRGTASTKDFPRAELSEDAQLLVGYLTNTFDFSLEDCLVAYDRSVYELGTIGPGESVRLGATTKRSELKTLLTGRKVVFVEGGDKFRQETTPYDPASQNVSYILRTMMFYDAAGGRRYTGLWNAYQSFVDLSGLLKTGRAIFVAQAPKGSDVRRVQGVELRLNDRPPEASHARQTTIYRFVYPVQKEKNG
ncbi:MAG: hypothetical protein ABFC88_03540 [Thermoguttaceae bacterium]